MEPINAEPHISLAALARKCDLPTRRAQLLVRARIWMPDVIVSGSDQLLFDERRVPELIQLARHLPR